MTRTVEAESLYRVLRYYEIAYGEDVLHITEAINPTFFIDWARNLYLIDKTYKLQYDSDTHTILNHIVNDNPGVSKMLICQYLVDNYETSKVYRLREKIPYGSMDMTNINYLIETELSEINNYKFNNVNSEGVQSF